MDGQFLRKLESISSTFYACILRQYFGAKNYKAVFWVLNFWHQNIGKKSASKMLMKLTPGCSSNKSWLESKTKLSKVNSTKLTSY